YRKVIFGMQVRNNCCLPITYSLLHGKMSSFGTAVNLKLLYVNFFLAADYIPLIYTPQMIPVNNSHFNLQTGINLMF
ncbi:MAG TPA: hypothetical protein PKZ18_08140, partial [Bacteroidales bacterium]|nr:hypothetical protein [Bacteroidales bacterium]